MIRLYLFRHAKSSWKTDGLDDFDRSLNGRGRAAAPAMGAFMRDEDINPELILCSAARRTRETLALILPFLRGDTVIHIEHDLYLADTNSLFNRLRGITPDVGHVMLIGHNPGMQDLAEHLIVPEESPAQRGLRSKFPTAALAEIRLETGRWADLTPHGGTLTRFTTPRALQADETG